MNDFGATTYMATLFVLRCVAPLLITIGAGYLMNRLQDRWAAEDALVGQPATASARERSPIVPSIPSILSLPCWLFNNCDQKDCAKCPAYQRPTVPCWQAHLLATGQLRDDCPDCPRYIAAHAAA